MDCDSKQSEYHRQLKYAYLHYLKLSQISQRCVINHKRKRRCRVYARRKLNRISMALSRPSPIQQIRSPSPYDFEASRIAKENWLESEARAQVIFETKRKAEECNISHKETIGLGIYHESCRSEVNTNEHASKVNTTDNVSYSNPELPIVPVSRCKFYDRTGCCRYGDLCRRHHEPITIATNVLLLKNLFSRTDCLPSRLKYSECIKEERSQLKGFCRDVVEELEKISRACLQWFIVCCNEETHLQGNVYAEWSNCRRAKRAYKKLYGRYYAGRKVNVNFVDIENWSRSVCNAFIHRKCTRDSTCNFIHPYTINWKKYSLCNIEKQSHDYWTRDRRKINKNRKIRNK
ncbi:hypothetical protein GJ496_005592 [Pomphorhynchus laevis]|nr:hypothetical protein GJ496_005592 [Pomphorhynchus laevis]